METTAMDTQSLDADFSFAFKHRSNSPAPYDCLAPATLQNSLISDSQSPPPSLTDSTSQASHGSPRDWSSYPWINSSAWLPAPATQTDQPWTWGHDLTSPTAVKPDPAFGSHSIDPAVLAFDDSFLSPRQPLLPNHSFSNDLFGLGTSQPLESRPPQIFTPSIPLHTPLQEQLLATSLQSLNATQSRDFDLIMGVIQAAGVQAAALPSNPADLVIGAVPEKSAAPPLLKPDLAACPPLAKHAQRRSSVSAPGSSAVSPSSTTQSLQGSVESQPVVGASGRPKTSHTTIERRYRTNLNARILSLRHAVPALRVLEKDENQYPRFPDDIVDARGFVDGVRVARKASKASILGKAAEYIHVLKKRELRLKHEAAGLKMLVGSLAGGPALLREFELRWKKQYGGEEKDEVVEGSDVEDGEDESDDEEKPRKKVKLSQVPASKKEKKDAESVETGKRKRGRPKKAQGTAGSPDPRLFSPTSSDHPVTSQATAQSQSRQPGGVQYMLGAFLFFSFFRNSANPHQTGHMQSGAHHHHSGSVLLPSNLSEPQHPALTVLPWLLASQHLPMVFAVLLVLSIVYPLVPSFPRSRRTSSPKGRIPAYEVQQLRTSLDVRGFVVETIKCIRGFPNRVRGYDAPRDTKEAVAWQNLCVGELVLSSSLSSSPPISSVVSLYRHLPKSSNATATLALTVYPLSAHLANFLWSSARDLNRTENEKGQLAHVMVFHMPVEEAYQVLQRTLGRRCSFLPANSFVVDLIADAIVVDAIHDIARDSFLRIALSLVRATEGGDCEDPLREDDLQEASRWIVSVGVRLPGPSRQLAQLWNCAQQGVLIADDTSAKTDGLVKDTCDLVHAFVLLRRTFPHQRGGLSSPSSTTTLVLEPGLDVFPKVSSRRRVVSTALQLRRVLASPIFSSDDEIEDARDMVIDMIYGDNRDVE